jgi:hypothetical protein
MLDRQGDFHGSLSVFPHVEVVKKWDWLRAETVKTLENQRSRRCLSQFFHSLVVIFGLLARRSAVAEADGKPIDYNRQIRPLLSDKCYACHGPDSDSREGGFRLDQRDSALGEGRFGRASDRAGRSGGQRDLSCADDGRRVHADAARGDEQVADGDEIETIRKWIEQGADWKEHWSFIAPERPPLPAVQDPSWPRNEIDHLSCSVWTRRLETGARGGSRPR